MLRNLHVSEVRRLARLTQQPLSILDYDTAAIGLHFTHPHGLLQVQESLERVGQYALRALHLVS